MSDAESPRQLIERLTQIALQTAHGDEFFDYKPGQEAAARLVELLVRNENDENELFRLATTNQVSAVRRAAVAKVSSPQRLYLIAVAKHDDAAVGVAAVRRLPDDANFVAIAKNALNDRAAAAAVDRLTDHAQLVEVVLDAYHPLARSAAVGKLADQKLIARVAESDVSAAVRSAAVFRLADKSCLNRIAQTDDDQYVRRAAVSRIDDEHLLAQIATKDHSEGVRCDAVKKLRDQNLLFSIARQDRDWGVRHAAIDNISDEALLVDIGVKFLDLGRVAIGKLTDQSKLARIARTSAHAELRSMAFGKVTDERALLDFVMAPKEKPIYGTDSESRKASHLQIAVESFRLEAIVRLKEQNATQRLLDIAIAHPDISVCLAARERLDKNLQAAATNAKLEDKEAARKRLTVAP